MRPVIGICIVLILLVGWAGPTFVYASSKGCLNQTAREALMEYQQKQSAVRRIMSTLRFWKKSTNKRLAKVLDDYEKGPDQWMAMIEARLFKGEAVHRDQYLWYTIVKSEKPESILKEILKYDIGTYLIRSSRKPKIRFDLFSQGVVRFPRNVKVNPKRVEQYLEKTRLEIEKVLNRPSFKRRLAKETVVTLTAVVAFAGLNHVLQEMDEDSKAVVMKYVAKVIYPDLFKKYEDKKISKDEFVKRFRARMSGDEASVNKTPTGDQFRVVMLWTELREVKAEIKKLKSSGSTDSKYLQEMLGHEKKLEAMIKKIK